MLVPIQRIPRYRLLLQSLLQATPATSPEYHALQRKPREGRKEPNFLVRQHAAHIYSYRCRCSFYLPFLAGLVKNIEEVNNHIDQAVQQQDARLQLLDLKRRLVGVNIGDLVAPGRLPVLESELVVVNCSARKVGRLG